MIAPVLIEPEALYDDGALRQALGLTSATLAGARRAGTLRYTRKGKRTFYKGAWIMAWFETDAEVTGATPSTPATARRSPRRA